MNSRSLVASAFGVWTMMVLPLTANAQSTADSVGILVQAAQVAANRFASGATVLLDPRPELRADSLAILAFEALQRSGLEVYAAPGIPSGDVWLLSVGTMSGSEQDSGATAILSNFRRRQGFLNFSTNVFIFHVDCMDSGCVLGDSWSGPHGDGHIRAECWEDYFARSPEGRHGCFGFPLKPGSADP